MRIEGNHHNHGTVGRGAEHIGSNYQGRRSLAGGGLFMINYWAQRVIEGEGAEN